MNKAPSPFRAQEAASAAQDAFDLRDLAPSGHAGPAQDCADPFGVLDIAGALPRPVADPLAELLGELPPRTAATALGITRQGRVAAEGRALDASATDPTALQLSEPDLFDGLHAEFVRVVRDPTHLTGRVDGGDTSAPEGPRGPSMEELSRDGEKYPMLCDIVQSRAGIDKVLDGFDPLGRPFSFDDEAPQEVLRLFAPERVHGSQPAIPSLTRREHHALSPDSHMPTLAARTAGAAIEEQLELRRSEAMEAEAPGHIPNIDEEK